MPFQHKELSDGSWGKLSLCEQLGNVGSEISRAIKWKGKKTEYMEKAIFRSLELLDLIKADKRWRLRLKEICRARELVCDAYLGGKDYGSTLESLEKYFFPFAYAARMEKINNL